jgi:Extracellular mutant protein 11
MQSYTDKHVHPPDPRRQQVASQARLSMKDVNQARKAALASTQMNADRGHLPTNRALDGSEVEFSEITDVYESPQVITTLKESNRANNGHYAQNAKNYENQKAFDHFSKRMDHRDHDESSQGSEEEYEDHDDEGEEAESVAEEDDVEHYVKHATPTRASPRKMNQNRPNGNMYQPQLGERQLIHKSTAIPSRMPQDQSNYSTDSGSERKLARSIPQRGIRSAKVKAGPVVQSVTFQNDSPDEPQYSKNLDDHANGRQPKQTGQNGKRSRTSSANRNIAQKTPFPNSDGQETAEIENLDYPLDKLKQMNYVDLQNEPFDVNPKPAMSDFDGLDDDMDLEEKLVQLKKFDSEHQRQFFESLTINEWDKTGDWFLDQFTQLMGKMRDARKTKRAIATKFEKEVSERQMAVEERQEGIAKTMESMRSGGVNALRACSQERA